MILSVENAGEFIASFQKLGELGRSASLSASKVVMHSEVRVPGRTQQVGP